MTRPGMPLDRGLLRRDVERVLSGYQAEGFWQASIAWPTVEPSGDGVTVRVQVTEGEITRVRGFRVEGGGASLDSVRFRSSVGATLRPQSLEMDCRMAVAHLEQRGYPFASATPAVSLSPGEGGAVVSLRVQAGPCVRIDRIRFEGNRVSREVVLRREVGQLVGRVYDQRIVDRAVRRLQRLAFITGVGEPDIERMPGDRYALVLRVKETAGTQVHGVIGYAPAADGTGRGMTGSFSLDVPNLAGTGRSGRVSWERRGAEASGLEVTYREPWVMGRPIAAGIRASMRRDPVFREDLVVASTDFRLPNGFGMMAGVRHVRVRPEAVGSADYPGGTETGLEAEVESDGRNDRWNPSRGTLWCLAAAYSRVSREGGSSGRTVGSVHVDHHLPMGPRAAMAIGLHASGVAEKGHVPLSSRLRLGGANTIRGYAEEAFLARNAVWSSLEWRLPMGARSRVFVFLDVGRLTAADGAGRDGVVYPVGYGAGLMAESRMGLVGLGYGLARGNGPGQGRLHVQLASSF